MTTVTSDLRFGRRCYRLDIKNLAAAGLIFFRSSGRSSPTAGRVWA